jgi:FAD/FMN-containing dehydrogenase
MDLHRHDMTATFAANVTLGAAQEHLARLRQWLPIDGDPASSIGDLISSNSTGPLRLGYGAWRDLLLGVQFTNGRGELISAGGRTVKNVAGYDLTKFIVGSAGVFGTIVTATLRTYRRPQAALLARFPADAGRVGQLMPTSLRPQWAMLNGDALLCGYLGDERTIEYYRTNLPHAEPVEVVNRSVDEDVEYRNHMWSSKTIGTAIGGGGGGGGAGFL